MHVCVCVFSVCDEHRDFKDLKLFYRFRKDDGTFPLDSEAKVFMRGQRIYEKYERTHTQALGRRAALRGIMGKMAIPACL